MPPTPTHHASGRFDVKMLPQAPTSEAPTPGATLGRALLDKQYHGDLQATAQGQMLSALSGTPGSAGGGWRSCQATAPSSPGGPRSRAARSSCPTQT